MIEHLRRKDGIQLSAFIVSSHFVHVYENKHRQMIVKSPGCVTDVSLSCYGEVWELWVTTTSSHVYRVTATNTDITGSTAHTSQQPVKDAAHLSNQEIFDDLLDNNTMHPFSAKLEESSEACIVLDERHFILQLDSIILHTAAVESHLWCLELRDSHMSISGLTVSSQDGISACTSPVITYHLNVERKYTDCEMTKCGLYLAVSQAYADCHTVSSCCVVLSSQTFSALFGMDLSLCNAPVLLVSTPEGFVYFRPCTGLQFAADRWKLLCDAGSPISLIACITLDKADHENTELPFPLIDQPDELAPDALVFCCDVGKVVVAGTDSRGLVYGTLDVPSSVSSWTCYGKQLFYSSGQSVFRSTITRQDGDQQDRPMNNLFSMKTERVHDISVYDMVFVLDTLKHDESLLCLMADGGVTVLDTNSRDFSQTAKPLNLKSHLLGLDHHSRRRECVEKLQENLNSCLRQINIAAHLISDTKSDRPSRLIRTLCKVECVKKGYIMEHLLTVRLTNETRLTLSPDWNVEILLTLPGDSETKVESYGFSLSSGLRDKSDFQVTIPLPNPPTVLSGVTVTVMVVLTCGDEVGDAAAARSVPVRVSTQVLDTFSCLQAGAVCAQGNRLTDAMTELATRRSPMCISRPHRVKTGDEYSAYIYSPTSLLTCHLGDGVSPNTVLKFLLEDCQVRLEDVKADHVELWDPAGNCVGLSVTVQNTEDCRCLTVVIKSMCLSLVAKCRMAVVRRLHISASHFTPCPRKQVHRYLTHMKALTQSVQTLQETCTGNYDLKVETVTSFYSLYKVLRQTEILSVHTAR